MKMCVMQTWCFFITSFHGHWFSCEVVICIRQKIRAIQKKKCVGNMLTISMDTRIHFAKYHTQSNVCQLRQRKVYESKKKIMQLCSQRQCNFNPSLGFFFRGYSTKICMKQAIFERFSCFEMMVFGLFPFPFLSDTQTTVLKLFPMKIK